MNTVDYIVNNGWVWLAILVLIPVYAWVYTCVYEYLMGTDEDDVCDVDDTPIHTPIPTHYAHTRTFITRAYGRHADVVYMDEYRDR